VYVEIYLL